MPRYKLETGEVWNIPDSSLNRFLTDHPQAIPIVTYDMPDNKKWHVPESFISKFTQDHPEATLSEETRETLREISSGFSQFKGNEPASGFSGNLANKEFIEQYDVSGKGLEEFVNDKVKSLGRGFVTTFHGLGGFLKYVGVEETGQNVEDFIKDIEDQYLKNRGETDIIDDLLTGVGSSLSFFIPGGGIVKGAKLAGMAPRLAALLGLTTSVLSEAAVEAGFVYDNSIERGKTREQAKAAATGTFAANLILIPATDKWFFNGSKIGKEVGGRLQRIFSGFKNEGFQEYAQELISSGMQGDDILSKEVQSSAVYQGVIGGITGGLMGGFTGERGKKVKLNPSNTDLLNPEEVDNIVREENVQRERGNRPPLPTIEKQEELPQQPITKPETQQDVNIDQTQQVTTDATREFGDIFQQVADVLDESQAQLLSNQVGVNLTEEEFEDLKTLSKTGSDLESFSEVQTTLKPIEDRIESPLGLDFSEKEYYDLVNRFNESLVQPETIQTEKSVLPFRNLKNTEDAILFALTELKTEDIPALKQEVERISKEQRRKEVPKNVSIEEQDRIVNERNRILQQKALLVEALSAKEGKYINYSPEKGWTEGKEAPIFTEKIKSIKETVEKKKQNVPIIQINKSILPSIEEIGGGLPFQEQPKVPEEPDTPNDDDKGEESTSDEPRFDSNYAANTLLLENLIRKDQLNDAIKLIRAMVRRSSTPRLFMETFRSQWKLSKVTNGILHGVYRREQTLEEFNVADLDIVMEGRRIKKIDVTPSTHYNHKGMLQSSRFLSNPLLNKFREKLIVIKGYISGEFSDKYQGKRKDLMPYNRHASLQVRDLATYPMKQLHNALIEKGLTLCPVSDSNTIMALRIDNKYLPIKDESIVNLKVRLLIELNARYPADKEYYSKLNTLELASELTRDDFLKEALPFWYSGGLKMNEVAKRFKLFLPKGEQLSFTRNINIVKVNDIWAKDSKGEFVTKPDGTKVPVTDGSMILNPRFATEFFQYNGLGDIKQDKTVITEANEKHNVAIKQMIHIATTSEWTRLCALSGVAESVDGIGYDSSFKLANKSDKSRYEHGSVIELEAKSFRHLFSGNEHSMATFSRQMFNFFGNAKELIQSVKDQIIDPIYANVKGKYLDFMADPKSLEQYMMNLFRSIPQEISDYRRYASQGAVLFKTLRSNIKKFLRTSLIRDGFIKLKQEGNYSYLKPDFFQEVNRGEIYVPYSEFERIFYAATKKGFTKYGKDLSIYSKDQYNTIRQELNKWLRQNEVKVVTARVPISRVENIQGLTIRKILDSDAGNCAVMNTIDAVYNKEADFDGDEIFFHYLDNISNLNILINNIAKVHENVSFINLTSADPGTANKLSSLYKVAKWSGDGKRAIGETAKANAMKAVLLANDIKLGELKTGGMRIVKPNDDMSEYYRIYKLRKDWTKWDRDISHTMQAAVDNLKRGALEFAMNWQIAKAPDGGYAVYYHLRSIYANMFEGSPDADEVSSALKPISNAMNLFSRNFAMDASWDQDGLNAEAQKYAKIVENMEGAIGNSIHEYMILKLADLGYMPNRYEFSGERDDVEQRRTDETRETKTVNNLHDNALSGAVSDFRQDYITNKEPENLSKTRKDEIKELVKQMYYDKKQGEIETGSTEEERYYKLYEEYLDKIKGYTAAERDYFDYLTIKGFTYNQNLQLTSEQNYRFILATLTDKNVKRITEKFNKRFIDLSRKHSLSLNFLIPINPDAIQEKWDSIKRKYGTAIANFFGDIHLKMNYNENDGVIYTDALKLVDRINQELYEIGRLPFSDVVDIRKIYESVLAERGKKFADDKNPLTAADGIAILDRLKRLHWNLQHGNYGDIASFTYFATDLFKNNPYTSKHIQKIDRYSSNKDAHTQRWMSWISYTGRGNVQKGIREALDMKQHGYVKQSYMHEALDTFNLYSDLLYYKETEQTDKYNATQKKIDKRLSDPNTKRQMAIIDDVVLALDGQVKIGETPEGKPLYIHTQEGYIDYLTKKWNAEVAKAYLRARELFNEIIVYDQRTWLEFIGPNTEYYENHEGKKVKSKQYSILSKLRQRLVQSGQYSNQQIDNYINELEIKQPRFHDNYYPHLYFGIQTANELSWNLMNALDISTPLKDAEDAIKSLGYWKEREREHQELDKMADRNLIRVLTRRANASVQARWQNAFKREYANMTASIASGMEHETEEGHLNNIKLLARLQAYADEMYKRVADIPEYSWTKSMSNVVKDLYLTNLLLLSTKGTLRNLSQGFAPNLIEFGGTIYLDGNKLVSAGWNPASENVGNAPGDITLTDGTIRNIFKELGVHRADIFAKIEGGQEWDIFKAVKKAAEYNQLMKTGTISEKAKFYLVQATQAIEESMNKIVGVAGKNNIFTLFGGVTRKLFVGTWDKIVPTKYRVPIPEMPTTTKSYSGVEYKNRAKTAAMAFISELQSVMKGRKTTGITPEIYEYALRYARQMVDKLQYNYNMWNRPIGLTGAFKSAAFQFKSYQLGTLKLHWNWLTDLRLDPYKNIHKPLWFAGLLAFLFGLGKWLHKDVLRFFEIPEIEFFSGLKDYFIGSRQEREWAWYGNRSGPVSGPIGGMIYESILASGLVESSSRRKQIAWFRLVESHVPAAKEFNQIYKETALAVRRDQDIATSILNYIGVYSTYDEPTGLRRQQTFKPERYEGPEREAVKAIISGRMNLYQLKKALYPKKTKRMNF